MKDHSRDDGIKSLEVTLLHRYSYSSHIQPLLSLLPLSLLFAGVLFLSFLFFFLHAAGVQI